jgi:hypothetical protein
MLTTKTAGGLLKAASSEQGGKVKIKMIANVMLDGDMVLKGQVVETSERNARSMIGMNRAVEYKDEPKPKAKKK